jgi:hypothetical protein
VTEVFDILGKTPKAKTCHSTVGLVEEGGEAIHTNGPAAVRDANLIGAAQRVEHYEMAAYRTARSFAAILGEDRVADLFRATLDEQGAANKKLINVASTVNSDALRTGYGASVAADRIYGIDPPLNALKRSVHTTMNDLIMSAPPLAAIGFSLIYLLFGGGLFGAVVIFIIAKMLGD